MTVICEASPAEWEQRRATWLASIGMTMDDIRAYPRMRQFYFNTLWHEYRLANQWFVQTCYLASEPSAIYALWNKAVRAGYLRAYADVLCYERDPLTGKILHLAYHDFDAIQTIRQAIHMEEEAARDDPMGLFCDALDPILMLHTSETTSMVARPRPKPGSTGHAGPRAPMTATGPVGLNHVTNYRQICLILIRDIMSHVAAYMDERPRAKPIEMDDERLRLKPKRSHSTGEGTVVTATKSIAEIRLTRVIRRIGMVYGEHAMPHNDSLYRFAYLCETPEPEDGQFIIPSQAVHNAVQHAIGLLDAAPSRVSAP